MLRSSGIAAAAAFVLLSGSLACAGSGSAADRDCSDFATQADAQRFFDRAGGGDPHQLDGDGNGVACEANPCPCAGPAGGGGNPGGNEDALGPPKKARVAAITDGDTFDVRFRGRLDTVRIIGIDTPERGRCGYTEATQSLAGLLRPGERIKLIRDRSQPGRDRYGRLLRYVKDGPIDTGRKQLLRGWARVLVVGTGFDRVRSYRKAVRKAKRRDKGVWGRC